MKQRQLLELYEQVLSNYEACYFDQNKLSDTWVNALEQKGQVYSIDDMIRLREPGNKVTSWLSDFSYLVDGSIIDLQNDITARLLDFGESDFGFPSKNIRVNGGIYTSEFLRPLNIASRVIQILEAAGNSDPRVMEIGGGLGIIPYLLRRYFGNRMTFFAVDIPETLLIQEWYLRNCLPDVPRTYVPDSEKAQLVDGGLNFINAHVLQDHDIAFDFVININSIGEMTRETSQAYIRYIEKNIAEDGFFFFQNHHGHSVASVPEPSEHELDDNWTIECAQLTEQFENCTENEMARFVFRRTQTQEPADARKLVLRLVWNGLLSGLLQNGEVIEDLIRVPRRQPLSKRIDQLGKVLVLSQPNCWQDRDGEA